MPPELTTPRWRWLPVALGGGYALTALTQLAGFEGFMDALNSYGLGVAGFALGIALLEILSLPVLFRLVVPRMLRIISTVAVCVVPLVWLFLLLMATRGAVENVGYFGDILVAPFAWWHFVAIAGKFLLVFFCLYVLGGKKLLQK